MAGRLPLGPNALDLNDLWRQSFTIGSDGNPALAVSNPGGTDIAGGGGGGGTQYTDGATPPANPVGNALVYDKSGAWADVGLDNPLPVQVAAGEIVLGAVNVVDTTDTEINPAITATYGSAFPATGTPAGFTDGVNMRPAFVAPFHNSDFQAPASNQYGLLSGGVAQIYDPGGFLDRQRGTGADGISAVGIATGAQQMAGPPITTTFNGAVTGNAAAQSVAVVSSASAKVGDVMLTQDNAEYVTITAIADGTHVTGIFKNNHASGQTLTWFHYNQARDATVGDAVVLTGMSASVSYLVNNITSTAEQERSAAGELDGASGRGTNIAAGYEFNSGGPYNGTAPSGLQFDRERTIQGKGLDSGTISNNPLAAGSTTLTLNSAPTTLMAGQQVILDRAGANPEAAYVGTGYTAGSTTVPLQSATAFSHAQNSTIEWDKFLALGPGTAGFLGAGLGIDDDVHYNPVDNKYYGDIAATADGNAAALLPLRAMGGYNGATYDRIGSVSSSTPNSLGTALLTGNVVQSNTFSVTSVTAGVVYDAGNYASVKVQVTSQYVGTTPTITFQCSNDGTNWYSQSLMNTTNSTSNGAVSTTTTAAYFGGLTTRYFRLNFTGAYSSGTATGVIVFSTAPASLVNTGVNVYSGAATGSAVPTNAFYIAANNASGNLTGINAANPNSDGLAALNVAMWTYGMQALYNGTNYDRMRSATSVTGTTGTGLLGTGDMMFDGTNFQYLKTASSLGDGGGVSLLATSQAAYNGTNWDRQRNNTTGVVIAAGATASNAGVSVTTYNTSKCAIVINISAFTSGSLTVTVNGITSSGYTYPILVSTALAATGVTPLRIFPGATASANSVANDLVPRTIQVVTTVSGTLTYGIDYELSV